MSLDIYLKRKKWISYDAGKTLTEEEEIIYDTNITHNLGVMADKAGIYEALWRPYKLNENYNVLDDEYEFEEKTVIIAKDIISIIEKGLNYLKSDPRYFETFNSSNSWGTYKHFVPFVEKYLEACKEYPEAIVKVSR